MEQEVILTASKQIKTMKILFVWFVFIDPKIEEKLGQDKKCLLKVHKLEHEIAVPIEKLKKISRQEQEK